MKSHSDQPARKPRSTDFGWFGISVMILLVGASIYLGVLLKHSVATGAGVFTHENVRGSMWFAIILLSAWVIAVLVAIRRR
jgi:hypothetical protein